MRSTSLLTALAASASAATISIDVGENGSLKFSPDSVTAAVGDTLEFHFYSGSGGHSVVSSSFSTPCQPATDAFFSGYIDGNTSGDMTFVTTVNSTDPIWFYCSLAAHCQEGMVGVVNPPSDQTVAQYAAKAQLSGPASAPANLQGGVLTTINPSAATSSGSSASSGSSTSNSGTTATTTSVTGSTTGTGSHSSTSTSSGATTGSASSVTGTNTNTQGSSTTSASATAATTTKSSAGMGVKEKSDAGALLGLAIFAGGLVALMA